MENDILKFEVSLLGQATDEYPNQFSLAAYLVKRPNMRMSLDDKNLKMTISDKAHYSDVSHSFDFTAKQMPFVWQSYGKYIRVSVNATQNDQPFFMWIIVNAIFEANSLHSYVAWPLFLPLGEHCLKNNYLSTGGKYCFSIHTNFTGSWLGSEDICTEKDGDLWQPNNKAN